MDAFQIIQHFFTRMNCQHCDAGFSSEDIELLRKEDTMYVVNVFCHKCDTQNGVALVGLESGLEGASFEELDEMDLEAAELDADIEAALADHVASRQDLSEPGNDPDAPSEGKPGRNAIIPEDVLMQLLAQAGIVPSDGQAGLPSDLRANLQAARRQRKRFKDPELTREERTRLSRFAPINADDVLDAHHFFQDLDADWMRQIPGDLIPEEMRQSQTAPRTESPSE